MLKKVGRKRTEAILRLNAVGGSAFNKYELANTNNGGTSVSELPLTAQS